LGGSVAQAVFLRAIKTTQSIEDAAPKAQVEAHRSCGQWFRELQGDRFCVGIDLHLVCIMRRSRIKRGGRVDLEVEGVQEYCACGFENLHVDVRAPVKLPPIEIGGNPQAVTPRHDRAWKTKILVTHGAAIYRSNGVRESAAAEGMPTLFDSLQAV